MKIYFDENFSPKLAQGLAILQSGSDQNIQIFHIRDVFGKGTPDETWIPKIAGEQGVVLTQDLNINRKKQQWELCEKHGLKIVFFKPPKKHRPNYWAWVTWVVKDWDKLLQELQFARDQHGWEVTSRSIRTLN